MILQEETHAIPNLFKYVKGEIHLVLVDSEKPKWTFRQDIENDTSILRSKVYTFGNRYGILTKKENNSSNLNIQGKYWQLSTLPNGKPILRNDKAHPKYIRLQEVI